MKIEFGAMAPRIIDQLRGHGIHAPLSHMDEWQRCADAMTTLNLHGLLPDKQASDARRRLAMRIEQMTKRSEARNTEAQPEARAVERPGDIQEMAAMETIGSPRA